MIRLISLFFIALVGCATSAEINLNLPSGWVIKDSPTDLPAEILALKKASTADESVQLTVVALDPVASVKAANDVVAGQISEMTKGGYIHTRTEEVDFGGFPARHIVGEFRSDQYEGAYLSDNYVVFSDAATLTIAVSIDDSAGGRELASKIHDWVSIPGTPASLSSDQQQYSENYEIGQKIGYYGFYALIGVVAIVLIRKRMTRNKTKATKAEHIES